MSEPIKVITFNESKITELGEAVYSNYEPGFQIDGVRSYDELTVVFNALRIATPAAVRKRVKFNNVYVEPPYDFDVDQKGPHIDANFHGFAVHHNISDAVDVMLATALERSEDLIGNRRSAADIFGDSTVVGNVRTGATVPGRLTIFSEGNVDGRERPFTGLLPTMHYFARKPKVGPNLFARYTTIGRRGLLTRLSDIDGYRIKTNAKRLFETAEEFKQAA